MRTKFLIAAVSICTMLAACGGGGSGGGGEPQAGQILLQVDNEGNVTEAKLNCTTGGKAYVGTYTPASVDFSQLGSCTNASGDADVANCQGTITATCGGAEVVCTLTAVAAQCACEGDVGTEFLQEASVIDGLISTAVQDANAGGCQVSNEVYTCDC